MNTNGRGEKAEHEMKEITQKDEEEEDEQAVQRLSTAANKRIQPWTKQITLRGVIASIVIGCIYSIILMKLNLTTGINPNLNVAAALLAYLIIQTWTKFLKKIGMSSSSSVPFTQQENTMIQTCAVACYTIAMSGGFGSYLLAMNKKTYLQTGVETLGNPPGSYKEPGIGWMTAFLFLVCFTGLFVLIPLRKVLIYL